MKEYEFRVTIRKADFSLWPSHYAVTYGGPEDVYLSTKVTCTMRELPHTMKRMSDAEKRPHCLIVSMYWADDRCPPGFLRMNKCLAGGDPTLCPGYNKRQADLDAKAAAKSLEALP